MGRRLLLGALAAAAAPFARSQPEPRRIGWMSTTTRARQQPVVDAFTARMEARGWRPGRDFVMVTRFGEGRLEALPALARELVALQPALIVGVGSPCTAALASETKTIPIIMYYGSSPVETGLVASLARPGGNVTGITGVQHEFVGKMLEVLRVAAPGVARVAVLLNPDFLGVKSFYPHAQNTAQRLGMSLHNKDLRRAEDFSQDELDRIRPDALYVNTDFVTIPLFPAIVQYAQRNRLPSIGVRRIFTQAGGLLSMGPDLDEMDGHLADFADRVLKGASPALMPVRQPSRYEIVVNRGTARAIGLPLEHDLLVRATEVID